MRKMRINGNKGKRGYDETGIIMAIVIAVIIVIIVINV